MDRMSVLIIHVTQRLKFHANVDTDILLEYATDTMTGMKKRNKRKLTVMQNA